MKAITIFLTVLLSLTTTITSIAGNYRLDEAHSHLGFKIRHLGFSNVRGNFDKFKGQGEFEQKGGILSKLVVTIDAASINTNEPDRDRHLRDSDFFHVKKYPTLRFKSTKITTKNGRPWSINGELTMRGVTKKVVLKVDEWGGTMEDAWGNQRIAFSATGKIDRRKFGLTWNKGLKKVAGVTVGNEVKFELDIQAIKLD